MKLTFCGAARQVTGSMFLLELDNGYKILVDCGMDMSRGRLTEPLFPFNPSDLNLVLLTHAHLDHSGNIPNLLIQGYRGQILCTPPTFALTEVILRDSALINTKNLQRAERKEKFGKKRKEVGGMYLQRQVDQTMDQFLTLMFDKRFEVSENLYITFIHAGHLLGASTILLEIKEKGVWKKIAFSGDVGRRNYPLLKDPNSIPEVDYLVCETTYGMREHSDGGKAEEIIHEIIKKACVDIPGRLIIPAFSIGRTQSLLFTLNKLAVAQKLPPIKVFADSPMAEESTRIYEDYLPLLNDEANDFYDKYDGLFDFANLIQISTTKESKQVISHQEPCIVIASSGMITGGRIENHLKYNLTNPYCTVLMIGYSAEGTTGHRLLNEKTVNIKGKNIPVMANIIKTDVFSGHGDKHDLLNFVKTQDKTTLKKIFLVHGEYDAMISFKNTLGEEGYNKVEMPKKGEYFEL